MGVKQRWKRTDKEYIDAQHASLLGKKEALYSSLRAAVVRRHLLKLKAKYADGQQIAKRLSKNISKETGTAHNILVDYNSVLSTVGKETCSLQEVLCPDAKFWEQSELSTMATTWDAKKYLIQAYLMLKRSVEELALLEKEKLNTLEYWSKLKTVINQYLLSFQPSDKHSIGVIALLKTRLCDAEHIHSTCKAVFATLDHHDEDNSEDGESTDYDSD
jgi:hypothetical protein